MAEKVIMPKQGLQMTEGTILEWKKSVGDEVTEGEVLFEIETDKLTITIDAAASGTLLAILKGEGETVPITETIGIIGEPGEDFSALIDEREAAAPLEAVREEPVPAVSITPTTRVSGEKLFVTPRARMQAEKKGIDLETVTPTGPDSLIIERDVLSTDTAARTAATPKARKQAEKRGIDLSQVSGTGPGGKVYSQDLPAAQAASGKVTWELAGMRKVIAERMRESLDTAAQAVHRVDVDMSEAVSMREKFMKDELKVSFNDLVIKVTAAALIGHPEVNRQLLDNNTIVQYSSANIGMAVALDEGLIVPVMKDCSRKSLLEIHEEAKRLAVGARSNTLSPDDFTGGNITISNLGMYGIDSFTAIINRPESAILAVGAVKEKPVVVDSEIVVRPICSISLTYDHRLIDGAPAAVFLSAIRRMLENPYTLL